MGLNHAKPKPEQLKNAMGPNWAKDQTIVKITAQEALKIAKEQEAEKIASGKYKVITITPRLGAPYRALVKTKK